MIEWKNTGKPSLCLSGNCHFPNTLYRIPKGCLSTAIEDMLDECHHDDILRLISPIIDDGKIADKLVRLRRKGVQIRLLTTIVDNGKKPKTKGWDNSQNIQKHDESIRRMAREGVSLKSMPTTPHTKLIHSERLQKAYFGSANLTFNSLRGDSIETGLVYSGDTWNALGKSFDQQWKMSVFSMRHRAGEILLEETHPPVASSSAELQCEWSWGGGQCFLTWPGMNYAPVPWRSWFDSAKNDILLVAMSFYDYSGIPEFGSALSDALDRGVSVRILVRQDQFALDRFPDLETIKLLARGAQVNGIKGLHAKGFVIDHARFGILSANFNPFSLSTIIPSANVETCIFHSKLDQSSEYGHLLDFLFENATHTLSPESRPHHLAQPK